MQPLASKLVQGLDLSSALAEELSASQNLLPDAPLLTGLVENSAEFAAWLRGQLLKGIAISPQEVVTARKARHGVRPVPIVGIVERVTYRALAKRILHDRDPVDRSAAAYIRFIQAPIYWSKEGLSVKDHPVFRIFNSEVKHVVKADIAAFYQYIDHELLAGELLNLGGDFDVIQALQQFLGELTSKSFGLPQLLDPSDWLSDVYADLVERDMLRRGFAIWRFNDDFRIACLNYPEALHAIEALDDTARSVGLTLNENKTLTVRFFTYAIDTMGLQADDEIPPLEQQDVEGVVADYTETDETDDASQSLDVIRTYTAGHDPSDDEALGGDDEENAPGETPNLRRLSVDDLRRLRRALRSLARVENPEAIAECMALLVYAPSLTPDVCRYLLTVADSATVEVRNLTGLVLEQVSLSDWQVMWLFRVARAARLLDHKPEWFDSKLSKWQHSASGFLRAEVVLALAEANAIDLEVIETALRLEPRPLMPWYLAAVQSLQGVSPQVTSTYVDALRKSDRLNAWLLPVGD